MTSCHCQIYNTPSLFYVVNCPPLLVADNDPVGMSEHEHAATISFSETTRMEDPGKFLKYNKWFGAF